MDLGPRKCSEVIETPGLTASQPSVGNPQLLTCHRKDLGMQNETATAKE